MSAPEHDWLLPPADLAQRLPAWLVALPPWAPWAAVWNEKRGKFDKLPKNPHRPKYGISTTTPEKWAALGACRTFPPSAQRLHPRQPLRRSPSPRR